MRLKRSWIREICIIFCFISGAVFLFGYHSRAAANKVFGNMTYFTSCPSIAKEITLVNGQNVVWDHLVHVYLYYGDKYVYGDFNHDDLRDAAVIISESQSASGDEIALAFLIHDGTRFVHKQSAYLGDSAIINSLKERGGKVIVDMFVHQEGDCQAGPTKRVKYVYAYDGPELWVEGTPLG